MMLIAFAPVLLAIVIFGFRGLTGPSVNDRWASALVAHCAICLCLAALGVVSKRLDIVVSASVFLLVTGFLHLVILKFFVRRFQSSNLGPITPDPQSFLR